jgi:Ca2+-binding RTX toxin-like protein
VITGLDIRGFYSGSGANASTANVLVYSNCAGMPCGTPAELDNQPLTGGPNDFTINFAGGATIRTNGSGTFWLAVQANLTYGAGQHQWFWANRTVQASFGAVWANPANGFGTGCTTWTRRAGNCGFAGGEPDQVFRVRATDANTCLGQSATIVGTSGPDTLTGTPGPDVIGGLGGNDHINGLGGDDHICGGAGNDVIDAGDGTNDTVSGGSGDDTLKGNAYAVVSYLESPAGVNVHLATPPANGSATGEGADTLQGFQTVYGSKDYGDHLYGDDGTNFFAGLGGNDYIDGGGGFDAVLFVGSVQADLAAGTSKGIATTPIAEGNDQLIGIEGLAGAGAGTHLTGDGNRNILLATGANATLSGGGDADTIVGGPGNDQLYGGPGDDLFDAGTGANTLDGGPGTQDELSFSSESFTAGVNANLAAGLVTVPGTPATSDGVRKIENLFGSKYPDVLAGDRFPNAVYGGAGNDTLLGRAGDDFLDGGADTDTAKGARGKDYCFDAEGRSSCEYHRQSAGAAPMTHAVRRLGELLPGSGLEVKPHPLKKQVALSHLIESHEPVCARRRHGGFTAIGPPVSILKPWTEVRWSAVLRHHGKPVKGSGTETAIADYNPRLPNTLDWRTSSGAPFPAELPWHRHYSRGAYSWTETVLILGSKESYSTTQAAAVYRERPGGGRHPTPCKFH